MSDVLLLNQDYSPINILPLSVIDWKHAIKLIFLGRINVVEEYEDWVVRSAKLTIKVPAVCVTKDYFNIKRGVKFSRHNLFLRDLYTCAYCDNVFNTDDLTLDHVIPRALGGKTTWENSVSCCIPCNSRKGNKLIKPLRQPYKPDYYNLVNKAKSLPFKVKHESWIKYLGLEKE